MNHKFVAMVTMVGLMAVDNWNQTVYNNRLYTWKIYRENWSVKHSFKSK